jgi:hypothetical protein
VSQTKTLMSNSYMRYARKIQAKQSMKQAAKRDKDYMVSHALKMQELRDAPAVRGFNQLDQG